MNATHPALTLVGAPYKRGAETPREGFDCYTLMRYVRRVWFARETPAGAIPAARLTSSQAAALAIFRTLGGAERLASPWLECAPAEGCAVALGRFKVSRLHHCGVYLHGGILHACEPMGVVWTPLDRARDYYARCEFFECPPAS